MITQFRVQNYKALRDVSVDLTPLHVLIGPNNSGKTSVLEAIQALCRSVDFPLEQAFVGSWKSRELVRHGVKAGIVTLGASVDESGVQFDYELMCFFQNDLGRTVRNSRETFKTDTTIDLTIKNAEVSFVYGAAHHGDFGKNAL